MSTRYLRHVRHPGTCLNLTTATVGLALMLALATGKATAQGEVRGWGTQVVVGDDARNGLQAIAAGWEHSLGLRGDGTIVAWGGNYAGQCDIPAPNQGFVAISGGGDHSLALRQDGSVAAWGYNGDGQCTVPIPNQGYTAVAGGWYHSLGLKADGSVAAWGNDGHGACQVPTPNAGFVAVTAGGFHCLALRADGSVIAWGYNNHGQTSVPEANSGFTSIAAGAFHSLALRGDGSIVAWGDNREGQCDLPAPNAGFVAIAANGSWSAGLRADGTLATWGSCEAGQCQVPVTSAAIVRIAAGAGHGLAILADGATLVWGANSSGQCGPRPANRDFVALAAGDNFNLALGSDGAIHAWGDNQYGQCNVPAPNGGFRQLAAGWTHGLALRDDGTLVGWSDNDPYGASIVPSPNAGFVDIAAGNNFSAALKADGFVVVWGDTQAGLDAVPEPNQDFVAIAAGDRHLLGIRSNGSLAAWGENEAGQCDAPMELGMTFVAIAAGANHSLGLRADGTLSAWGGNEFGQCDIPDPGARYIAIAAGATNSLALRVDGTLVAWGGDESGPFVAPTLTARCSAIALGGHNALALLSDVRTRTPTHVSPAGSDIGGDGTTARPYRTIRQGLLAAPDGGTVVAACGTYREGALWLRPGISIASETGSADCTIIEGTDLQRTIYAIGVGSDVTIRGLTITGGRTGVSSIADQFNGGGMYAEGCDARFEDCRFVGNDAAGGGGGAYLTDSNPVFERVTFANNAAGGGGALMCGSGAFPAIRECSFVDNSASDGGAIYGLSPEMAPLSNCTFVSNWGGIFGAAVSGSGAIDHSLFAFNESPDGGSVIHGAVTLECCDVFGHPFGDYVDGIAGQAGVAGNQNLDPLFVDLGNRDLRLRPVSPCAPGAPGNGQCGLIGALGLVTYPLRVFVYGDRNGNGLYEAPADTVLAGARLSLDDEQAATADASGRVRFSSATSGRGHSLVIGASAYAGRRLEDLSIPPPDGAELAVGLVPLNEDDMQLIEINPRPNDEISTVSTEGSLHRYYQLVDAGTGEPAAGIPVTVELDSPAKSVYDFTTNGEGLLDVTIAASDLRTGGETTPAFVTRINHKPVAPLEFRCELRPSVSETSFRSEGANGLKFMMVSRDNQISSTVTLRDIDPRQPGPERIRLDMQRRSNLQLENGVGVGFYASVNGPVNITGAADFGASVYGGSYEESTITHEFAWPPLNGQEATRMFLLFADGSESFLDATLRQLAVKAVQEVVPAALGASYRSDGWRLGVSAGAELHGNLGIADDDVPLGLAIRSSLDIGGGGFLGATHEAGGSVESVLGFTGEVRLNGAAGAGIPMPNVFTMERGARGIVLDFIGEPVHFSGAWTGNLFLRSPSWRSPITEVGFERSSRSIVGGDERQESIRFAIRDPALIARIQGIENQTLNLFTDFMQSGFLGAGLSGAEIGNALVATIGEVTRYQDAFDNGSVVAGNDAVLEYTRTREVVRRAGSPNWSYDLGIDVSLGGASIGASLGSYALREVADRSVVEKGSWIKGVKYPSEKVDFVVPATSSTYKEIIQQIVDDVPWVIRAAAFPMSRLFSWWPAPAKADSVEATATLQDGRSTLTLRPTSLPAGTNVDEVFWTWGDRPANAKEHAATVADIVRGVRKRAESAQGAPFGFGGFHRLVPDSVQLAQPAVLSLAYADSELAGVPESRLAVYREDEASHMMTFVGGAVDSVSNIVTVPLSRLGLYTVGRLRPFGAIRLSASPDTLPADGLAVAQVATDTLRYGDGRPVADGTRYTVSCTHGEVLGSDLAPAEPGQQLPAMGGVVTFGYRASRLPGEVGVQIASPDAASVGVVSLHLRDTGAPAVPGGLQIIGAGLDGVVLSWRRNPEPDIAGYRLHFDMDDPAPPFEGVAAYPAPSSPIDVGNDTTVTVVGLENQQIYFWTVSAYDVAGHESAWALPAIPASTTDAGPPPAPLRLELEQNRPNPFNPVTVIVFHLPAAGSAQMTIYDVRGRVVRRLVDGQRSAGRHAVTWRGEDDDGRQVASGVYCCVLQTDTGIQRTKMVLIR